MLAAAPKAREILPQFKDFISNSVLIGHNVNFDINFLYDNFDKYLSTPLLNNFIDTMRISRRLHPEERHHRLMDLCERYNINYAGAHRAIFDCEITQQCLDIMKAEIIERFQSFDAFKNQIKTIKRGVRASDITAANEEFDETHPLYGKVCVFTGALQKMTRKEAMQIVVNFGGINGDTVTKKTNFLVLGNNDYCSTIKDGKSTKQKKAEKLILSGADLVILSENVFYDLIN